jgi:CRP-like cAMP-binding protein
MTIDYDHLQDLIKEGKVLEALRTAVALFQENTSNVNLWYEVANLCLQLDDRNTGIAGLEGAGREYAENGNLPMAIVCARSIEEAGGDAANLKRHVANLFGEGSRRVRNRAMPVPPLPSSLEDKLLGLRPEKDFLLAEASRALSLADASARMAVDMRSVHPPVPYFPMFGSLSEENFIELMGCFAPRRFYRDELLIKQGDEASDFHLIARGELKIFIAEKIHDDKGRTQQMTFKHVATLGPGTFVGEMGIVARTPRSANVQAASNGMLLSAGLESIESLASKIPEVADIIVAYCEVRLLENVMSASPILAPIEDESEKATALKFFERLYVPAGEVLIREGQQPRGIYVIDITTLTSGDIVGEISTVMKKPATASVHAITDASLLHLSREKFLEFTKTYPEVFQKVYEIVASREDDIEKILSSKTARVEIEE